MKKKITKLLILSVFLTVLLPAGIVCTVLGAVRGQTVGNILLGVGIAAAVAGFYGTPFLWLRFGTMKEYQNIYNQITVNHTQNIGDLALINGKKQEDILKSVTYLISHGYLTDYEILDGLYLVPKESRTLSKDDVLMKEGRFATVACKGCGATFPVLENDKPKCPYCGRRYDG